MQKTWINIDLTVIEGIAALDSLTMIEETLNKGECSNKIPKTNNKMKELLDAVEVNMPRTYPSLNVIAVERNW